MKPRSILKQLCIWLVQVVNANKQLSVSKKFYFKYRISMIKAKLSFFWTLNSEGYSSHGNNGTMLFLGQVNCPMSVISTELYFVEIGWVRQQLQIFKCTMLKTLNSDFLDWEDTLIKRSQASQVQTIFLYYKQKQKISVFTDWPLCNWWM